MILQYFLQLIQMIRYYSSAPTGGRRHHTSRVRLCSGFLPVPKGFVSGHCCLSGWHLRTILTVADAVHIKLNSKVERASPGGEFHVDETD